MDETEPADHFDTCDMCGGHIGPDGPQWILLNRYAIGTESNRCYTEVVEEDTDESLWDVETEIVSGTILCYPQCLHTWIEGRMLQVDFDAKKL